MVTQGVLLCTGLEEPGLSPFAAAIDMVGRVAPGPGVPAQLAMAPSQLPQPPPAPTVPSGFASGKHPLCRAHLGDDYKWSLLLLLWLCLWRVGTLLLKSQFGPEGFLARHLIICRVWLMQMATILALHLDLK